MKFPLRTQAPLQRPLASLKAAFGRKRPDATSLRLALQSGGLQAAIALLNRRVPHRYTAVHQLVLDQVTSLAIQDALGEDTDAMRMPVDQGHSFCQYAIRDGHFITEDSAADARLDGNPFQGKITSYHGVALTDAQGNAFGSLCHFDTRLRFLGVAEFEEMRSAAAEISAYLRSGDGPRLEAARGEPARQ